MELAALRSSFINVENTEELFCVIQDILPIDKNCFKIINIIGSMKKFKASVDCQITSEEDFIKSYQQRTNEILRKRTAKIPSSKNRF